jgi:hypothetical protein
MQKLYIKIKDIRFTDKSAPWILLGACVLAFGLLIPKLGYFQDDWNFVFNSYSFGSAGIADFLRYDGRPFAAWIFDAGFKFLGFKPIYWHITELLLRWLTGYVLWLVFRILWPDYQWQTLTAALLFLLYPFFTLQPLALTYTLHWTGYLLFALSIYFMLRAQIKQFWLFTILALATQALHLFTLEFYTGIDLLRPVLFWITLSASDLGTREKLKTTLHKWAPYLAIFILYFVWRVFLYQAAEQGRNTPLLLAALLRAPLDTIISTVNNGLPDLVLILISSWYKLIQPDNFNFANSANLDTFVISLISFGLFYFLFLRQRFTEEKSNSASKYFLILGIIALLLSLLPVYAAGYVIHTKNEPWNSRFSLGSSLGAALIITALVDYAIKASKARWVLLSVVIALLIGWHLHYTNDFRWAWDKQVNFYRQLYLRAPEIAPNTAILSEGELFLYMGDYPTAYGINLIYTPKGNDFKDSRIAKYWFFPLAEFYTAFDEYLNGRPFAATRAGTDFNADPQGSFVISYEPELGQCLWVMRPEYASLKTFSQNLRKLSSISFVDRIHQAPQNPDSFLLKYLYPKPEHDWCYYYEQADLAYQYQEWDQVIQLWGTANKAGLQPGNGFELLPFIEAYAHTGDWATARKMTRASQKTMQGIEPLLCNIWTKFESDTPSSTEKEGTITSVKADLRCDP